MTKPRLTSKEITEHLTPPPGITIPPYPARRDRVYRTSLLVFTFFLVVVGVGYEVPLKWVGTVGHVGASVALLVAGWTFLVWLSNWRWLVRSLVIAGAVVAFFPSLSVLSWAFTLGASAIMAAKETHCFHFWAGRVIPWYALGVGLSLLVGLDHIIEGVLWLGMAGLWAALMAGRLRLPLFVID